MFQSSSFSIPDPSKSSCRRANTPIDRTIMLLYRHPRQTVPILSYIRKYHIHHLSRQVYSTKVFLELSIPSAFIQIIFAFCMISSKAVEKNSRIIQTRRSQDRAVTFQVTNLSPTIPGTPQLFGRRKSD